MNSQGYLAEDLETLKKRTRQIGWVAWAVAIFVMIYGTPIVYELATDHGIPAGVAWMLSLAADGALCVGLIATPVLAQLGVSAGWVGTLRWVSGLITWALQTASSWIAPNGPDMVGVGVHTAGPLLLFFVVEAASYFQRKVSTAIEEKTRALASAEQKDADRRARYAEMEADLRATRAEVAALTSERDRVLQDLNRLAAEATSGRESDASTITNLRATVTDLETQIDSLHTNTEVRVREASEARSEELRELRRENRQLRLEASVPHLDARRRDRSGGATKTSGAANLVPSNRSRFTDEEAVQHLLEVPSDPVNGLPSGGLREWSKQAIVNELGVGWTRAPRLLEKVTEAQQQRAAEGSSEQRAVGQ